MRNIYALGAAMLLASSVDIPGVTYEPRRRRDSMGFDHDEIIRVVPPIKATDADLFGSSKGKRAKRRHKK